MRREGGMAAALVLMCIGLFISNPDFLGQSNAVNTLRQISMLGIYSIGMGFVVVTGGIDLSVGVAVLLGLLQGLLITRLNLQPFIVTLGGMLLIRGVSQTIVQGGTLSMGTSPLLKLANEGLFQ